ncbi:TonB family protein [Microbulbifer bruguierae]|uniref:TonB family protein n=1 Tax=Microbulbifer bruguierae TaxID=3029061 RepID=A0ABY8NBZ1_9GAMM|nr:TonB family protein [Microbulbifer bruguierae]WGL15965.1 TonB family protein [Microbulbifer bruguierae]
MEQAFLSSRIYQLTDPPFSPSIRLGQLARSGSFALGVTGLLLLGMTQLIATDYGAPPVEPSPAIAPIHMPDVKPTVYTSEQVPKPQELPPQIQPTTTEQVVDPGKISTSFDPPVVTKKKFDPTIINADPLPIYKPAPRYPRRALAQGMEGYVVVEFTISKNGSVKNPRVVGGFDSAGAPTDLFDRSALNAVERFKYRPPMSEGQPVEKHGVRNRIVFKLAK